MNFDDLTAEQQRRLQAILSDPTLTQAEVDKEYVTNLRAFSEEIWKTWERPHRNTTRPATITSR